VPSNFLTARGFTWQAMEDKIADRVWAALYQDDPLRTLMGGRIQRQHIHLSGVPGRQQPCVLVAVIRNDETPKLSHLIDSRAHVGIMLEFEDFASDLLQPGEPSIASLSDYMRVRVDRRFANPLAGEERLAAGALEWADHGPVPTAIPGSVTSFFVALEVSVPYKVTNPERINIQA